MDCVSLVRPLEMVLSEGEDLWYDLGSRHCTQGTENKSEPLVSVRSSSLAVMRDKGITIRYPTAFLQAQRRLPRSTIGRDDEPRRVHIQVLAC